MKTFLYRKYSLSYKSSSLLWLLMMHVITLSVKLSLQIKASLMRFSTHVRPSCFIQDGVNSRKHDKFTFSTYFML